MRSANKRLEKWENDQRWSCRERAKDDLQGLVNHLAQANLVQPQADVLGRLIEWYFREMEQEDDNALVSEEDCRIAARAVARQKLEVEILCYGVHSSQIRDTLDLMARIGY